MRCRVTTIAVARWARKWMYSGLRLKHINALVIYVLENSKPVKTNGPRKGEMKLGAWIKNQAAIRGVPIHTMWMRYYRRLRSGLTVRRVSHSVVYVHES